MELVLLGLLVIQGILGGFDTVVNHDIIENLPGRPSARTEVGLHALREALYASLFAGIGWFAWHGAMVGVVGGLLFAEFAVSTVDEYVENRTRVLPQNERILHVFLTVNFGLILAAATLVGGQWLLEPTALVVRDSGPATWTLTVLAVSAVFWAGRDFVAWHRLGSVT
jgi:hypothetical protein